MKPSAVITFLFLQTLAFGQIVPHFENPDSRWTVAESYPDGNQQNPSFVATTTSIFGIQGDTLINGESWNKIYETNDSLFQNNLQLVGMTRVENDQVLFLDPLGQPDTLYDFSLNVGDSVLYNLYGNYPEWIEILSIDSIQINGDYYKRFHFDEPMISAFDWLDEIWIEGIGSIHGPLFPRYPRKFSEEMPDSMLLTCSFSAGQEVWSHADYDNCYVNIVWGLQSNHGSDFNVHPNPVESKVHIQSKNNTIQQITISNHLGQVIRVINHYSMNESIDLSSFEPGIYFLKIQGDQSFTLKRVVKN